MKINKDFFRANIAKLTNNATPFISLLVALLALSITAILIRISLQEISANTTVFNRLWMATVIFGLWNGISLLSPQTSDQPSEEKQSYFKIGDILLLAGVAIAHLSGRLLWTISLTQTSVANANILGALTPLFVTLGSWLLWKQRFDSRFLIGLLLAIVGTSTLAFEDFFKSSSSFIGDSIALSSAFFYSINFLILEKLRAKFPVKTILIWRCFMGTIFMLPVVLIFEDQIFPISLMGWFTIFCLAFICEVVGHGLVVYSMKHFTSSFISLTLLLDPIIAAILAWILFAENLSLFNLVGFAVIMQGIYLAKTGQGSNKENNTTEDTKPVIEPVTEPIS